MIRKFLPGVASFIHWLVTLWSPEEEELHKQHFFLWMGLSLSLSCITLPIQGIINLLAMHLLCHTSNLLLLHFKNWMDLFNLFIIKSQRTFPLIFCNRFFFFCFVLCLMRSNNILIFLYSNEFMQILKSGRHAAVEEALESFEYAQSVLISRPASTLTQAALVVMLQYDHFTDPAGTILLLHSCAHLLCVCSCIESHLTLSVWSPLVRSAPRKPTNTHWGLVTGTQGTRMYQSSAIFMVMMGLSWKLIWDANSVI